MDILSGSLNTFLEVFTFNWYVSSLEINYIYIPPFSYSLEKILGGIEKVRQVY